MVGKYWNHLIESNSRIIICDASKNIANEVGVAVQSLYSGELKQYKTVNNITINTAEAMGISISVDIAIQEGPGDVVIVSDSLINIRSLSLNHLHIIDKRCRTDILSDIITKVNNFVGSIKIVWIPSHIHIEELDDIDRHAKLATLNGEVLKIPWGYVDIKKHLMDMKTLEWNKLNKEETRLNDYLKFIGYPNWVGQTPPDNFSILPRKNEIIANRLRLDQCKLPAYLHKLGLEESPLCNLCTVPETVTHILTECQKHTELHNKLNEINKYKTVHIAKLLFDQDLINAIISYIIEKKLTI